MSAHFDRAVDSIALQSARRTVDALQMREERPDTAWLELCSRVNPAQVILDLSTECLNGAGREASRELEKRRPITGGNGARLPWQTLAMLTRDNRADIVGTTTLGGYLVPTLNAPSAAQSLLPMLVLGRLGCTAVDAPGAANLAWPKVATSATVAWQTSETSQISEVEQTFGQLSLSPHTVGGYTEISRLLLLQSLPSAGVTVSRDLMRRVSQAIDIAGIAGTGTAGQPHGIVNLAGANAISGATYALATGMSAITDTGDALLDSARPGFAANRSVASLLRQRQEFSGSSLTLWRGALTAGELHDFPAFSTSGIASGTAIFGNWAYLVLADFSGGLDVEVNPFATANFQAGIVGLRSFATIDFGAIWPAAFSNITSIT
jgi:HK97 family phage major capsid protein